MATKSNEVVKIYSLKTIGYDDLHKQLQAVTSDFDAIRKAKLAAQGQLSTTTDVGELKKLSDQINALKLKEQELRTQRQQMMNEAKAAQIQRQQEINQQKLLAQGNEAAAGSYRDVANQLKILRPLIQNANAKTIIPFAGQNLSFNQAIAEFKKLSDAEQAFRRQFQKDGTLVGEYTTGINQSFKGFGNIGGGIVTGLSNGFKNLTGQAAKFALTFIGVQAIFFKLSSFVEGSNEAFLHAETSVAKFKATLSNLGRESEFEFLNKQIKELSARFKFLNEHDLQDVTDQFVTFGKISKEQIAQLLPVLVDFSTKQRKPLLDVAELFSKFIQGTQGAGREFGKYGITIKDAATETGRFNILIDTLGQKFKGQAEVFDKTVAGAQARNKEGWVRIREEVGAKLIPILTILGTAFLSVVSVLLSIPWPFAIVLIGGFTAALTANYIATSIATKQGLIYSAYLTLQQIRTQLVALATRIATAEIVLFNGAIRISPVGIFLTALGLLIPAIALFAEKLREAKKEQTALQEVNKAATSIYIDNISQINGLIAIIKSEITSIDTKKKAYNELIAINKDFIGVMKDDIVQQDKLKEAYDKTTKSIELQARAQASANLTAEKKAAVTQVQAIRTAIEEDAARNAGTITDLTTSQLEQLYQIPGVKEAQRAATPTRKPGQIGIEGSRFDLKAVLDAVGKEETAKIKAFQAYQQEQDKADVDLQKYLDSQKQNVVANEVDIKALRLKIETLDKDIQDFAGTKADLAAKIDERDAAQKELNKLLEKKQPKQKGDKADKLSVDEQNAFKNIDAIQKQQLADQELLREKDKISEETYLNNILKINKDAIDKKIALLKKGNDDESKLNAEEKLKISELNLEKVKNINETNKKLECIKEAA
jgi:hypothetical protein